MTEEIRITPLTPVIRAKDVHQVHTEEVEPPPYGTAIHALVRCFGLGSVAAMLLAGPVFDADAQPQGQQVRQFPPGSLSRLEELPSERLRTRIERLPRPARERAMAWLRSFHFTEHDLGSMEIDAEGGVRYVEPPAMSSPPSEAQAVTTSAASTIPVNPFPETLLLHSRPGAPNVLYLNFSGENVTGTAWNSSLGRTVIPALPFSKDTDHSTFSAAEQLAIQQIWQRVAEDYAPFDIDVTTERPPSFGPRTAHALITRSTDADELPNPSSGSAGTAYVNVFGGLSYTYYLPAWIYADNLAGSESYIAEAISHEIGHNLGLSHDGTTDGSEYYGGHGTGETSWAPLMGTGYNRNVTQWSAGEYHLANNTQDDLATIAAKLSFRTDDHANLDAAATPLATTGGTTITVTTPEEDPANLNPANKGVLENDTDVDVFSLTTGNGQVHLEVAPWTMPSALTDGGNLDLLLELYDDNGAKLLTSDPADQTSAQIDAALAEGVYYLHVRNAGAGAPMSSPPYGYTTYGSIGQYFISGSVAPVAQPPSPLAQLQNTDLTEAGVESWELVVVYSDNAGIDVATVDDHDVRVTGPYGYDHSARLVSVSPTPGGEFCVTTYAVDPPSGGEWMEVHNGAYTVWMQAGEVGDIEGQWVEAGMLGRFNVIVPSLIFAATMDEAPGWILEGQWQYGAPSYLTNGPISGFTGTNIIGYNLSGNYENHLALQFATTPVIGCSNATTLTLRFQRWLRTIEQDAAIIQISTDGLSWKDVWSAAGTVDDTEWQAMEYDLPAWAAGSPTVQLRWGIGSGPYKNDIGWNIDDVEIVSGGRLDMNAPTPVLNVADITSEGAAGHSFTVTFDDETAVLASSIGAADAYVTGPNDFSNLVAFAALDTPGDGTPRTAEYYLPAPGGAWDAGDNGSYQVVLRDGEIQDVFYNTNAATELGAFTVNIAPEPPVLVVDASQLQVVEGSNAVFHISLSEPPDGDVVVTVVRSSGDSDLVVQSGSTNRFDASSWSEPVPVVIAALSDPDQAAGSAEFLCLTDGLPSFSLLAAEVDMTPDAVLTATANNPAWGTVTPSDGSYPVGSSVEITATPALYYRFVGWAGDASGSENPTALVLNGNASVQAQFGELLTTNCPTPHWWLALHGYTNDFETAVTSMGANGMVLWQSYVADLNPNDPTSQFRLAMDPGADANSLVLSWNTVKGRLYSVWQCADPADGFTPVPGATNLPWTTYSFTTTIDPSSPIQLYKVDVRME